MRTFLKRLLQVEAGVAVAAYTLTAGLLVADVISRELFSQAIWGAQKMAVFGAIVAGILGLTIAVADNAHLRATFADRVLPFPWVDRLGDLISAALFAALGYYALIFVSESITFADRAAVIQVPLWPFQAIFPYAFFASALRHLAFAWDPTLKPLPDQDH